MRKRSSRPYTRVLSVALAAFHLLGPVRAPGAVDGLATFAVIGPPSSLAPEQKALWAKAVEPVRSDPLLLMKDQEAVREVLAAWVEEKAGNDKGLTASALAVRSRVQDLLERAWDSYYAFDFKSSLSELRAVEESLKYLPDPSLQVDLFFQSLVLKGMNHRTLGSENYLKHFEEAAGIKPEARLNSEIYSPDIIDVFEKARKRVRSGPRSTLTVSGHPAGSTVFVDGRNVGNSPVTVDELASGTHLLRVDHEGYGGSGEKVRLEPWKVSTFHFRLGFSGPSGVPEDFFADRAARGDGESLAELSRRLEVDYLVVGAGGENGLAVWLMDVDGNPVSQEILYAGDDGPLVDGRGLYTMLEPLRAGGPRVFPTPQTELNVPEAPAWDPEKGGEMKKGSNTKWYVLLGGVLVLALVAGSARSGSGGTQVGASW